ncbi:hypothetical protein A3D71_02305 [Candidatus Kaiserbacteria bacterium RIFCSPHIGHO2_02_FULL_55_20]|uniref:EamA domain-containing protein n=1 Tax=Candidatus Kaiserbacteria bacterium RIFCSPHIGHO2_02_FULL_55_20 TaxID=1798497 RepID=A0A1F6DWJ4_9BACT|nr:MAG: hypothetical protein A2680_00580 [Candidatus Kaiserbacteria bacterium RIFCSPHIGHO2_01_FULL_55_37]OGG65756.1 MAG: hypothetical protein A3D71_02305 [Candidatus Kaiserbacteria bacterium RIFCSPHIGHO2_02_FULL_55_20]
MALSETRKGELYLFSGILIWGLFPVVTALSYAGVPAAISFLWSTVFATVFFAIMLTYQRRWSEIKNLVLWRYSLYIAISIGVLFYGFYFLGLEKTTPGNAAIIVLFEVFTAFVFFRLLRSSDISLQHVLGSVLMVLGALVILAPNFNGFNSGDLLVLAGTLFTPVGNYFQQKARLIASSEMIMFLRSLISIPFIVGLAYVVHVDITADIRPALLLLIINGVFLLGLSKIFWIEAIHRMSVPKGTALQSFGPFVTLLFAWIILSQTPSVWQLASLAPLVFGVLLLTDQIGFSREKTTPLA